MTYIPNKIFYLFFYLHIEKNNNNCNFIYEIFLNISINNCFELKYIYKKINLKYLILF